MDIPQSWQQLTASAEHTMIWLGGLPMPGLRVVDGLLLLSALLLLIITLILLRQRRRMKHTEQARNNAEALASCLFDALPDAATITDPEGRFLSVNPAFAQLVGREEREIAGALLTDLFTPAVAERFQYRPVEGEDDEVPEAFRIRADLPARFLAQNTPLFDTEGLLVGVLTQLSPEREATPSIRPAISQRKRRQRSAGVRTTPVNIDIGAPSEPLEEMPQAEGIDTDSHREANRPAETVDAAHSAPGSDTCPPEPEARPDFSPDALHPPRTKPSSNPEGMPNLAEALQIAVKITSNTDKEPPSSDQEYDIEEEPPRDEEGPHILASSQFRQSPDDAPSEWSLRGLEKH